MGFTAGFLGGLTLTYSVLYLSLYLHRNNRVHQSLLLSQQSRLLNSKLDPPEVEYEPPAYRIEEAGLNEMLKDRWNREVEGLVRRVQDTDWEEVRIRWENRVGSAWDNVRGIEKVQELEQRFQETVLGAEQDVKKTAKDTAKAAQPKRLLEVS